MATSMEEEEWRLRWDTDDGDDGDGGHWTVWRSHGRRTLASRKANRLQGPSQQAVDAPDVLLIAPLDNCFSKSLSLESTAALHSSTHILQQPPCSPHRICCTGTIPPSLTPAVYSRSPRDDATADLRSAHSDCLQPPVKAIACRFNKPGPW